MRARLRVRCLGWLVLTVLIVLAPAFADEGKEETDPRPLPWDRAYVQLGGFVTALDSSFRVGSSNVGVGVSLDVEAALGLEESLLAFRFDGGVRFTKRKKHRLDVTWFSMDRTAVRTIGPDEEIRIPDPDDPDNDIVLTDTTIESKFNFDIVKVKYKYSFLLDHRVDVFIGGGLYVMPIEFGLGEQDQNPTAESITAPLPVISSGVNVSLAEKWVLRQEFDLMYLSVSGFTGQVSDFNLAVERDLGKSIALGLGLDSLQIEVESEDEGDYPGVDFEGKVEFRYFGLQFYLRGRF